MNNKTIFYKWNQRGLGWWCPLWVKNFDHIIPPQLFVTDYWNLKYDTFCSAKTAMMECRVQGNNGNGAANAQLSAYFQEIKGEKGVNIPKKIHWAVI